MYPMDDTVVPSFTCHIGHKLTGAAMLSAQRNRLEYGLCMILTQFKERIELCRILGTVQPDVADDLGKKSLTRQRKALGQFGMCLSGSG
jgi:hypothetical protein